MSRVWGGLPTHTLSPALFSHPLFSAQCSGYVRCPQFSPNQSSKWRKKPSSIDAIPCFNVLPLQTLLGLLFFFLLFFTRPASPSYVDVLAFSHPGLPLPPDSRTTGSHAPNGAGLRPLWCRSPTWLPKSHTGPYTGFSLFVPRLSSLSPTGKVWVAHETGYFGFAEFAQSCPTRLQRGGEPASPVSFPHPALKIAHRVSQGRVWFHHCFLMWFFCGIPASWRSRWQSTAS